MFVCVTVLKLEIGIANCTANEFIVVLAMVETVTVSCDCVKSGVIFIIAQFVPGGFGGFEDEPLLGL